MGRRISFSLQEALANPAVSINLSTEVLKGDPDSAPGTRGAADVHLTTAQVMVGSLDRVFDLHFDHKGQPELSCDFNAWSDNYKSIQKIIDVLGVTYHVH